MGDYSTFVNGYENNSFDYLFDKPLFFIFFKKLIKPKNRPKSQHIKSGYQPLVIGFNNR
jgi:hypothetical protein